MERAKAPHDGHWKSPYSWIATGAAVSPSTGRGTFAPSAAGGLPRFSVRTPMAAIPTTRKIAGKAIGGSGSAEPFAMS